MKAPDVFPFIQILLSNSVRNQCMIKSTFFTIEGESIEYLKHEVPEHILNKICSDPEFVLDWTILLQK